MTEKQKLVIDYLLKNKGQAYYIDIRNSASMQFESEHDFDQTLYELLSLGLIFENDDDTLYILNS